jgi:hypothetical protein
VFFPVVDAVSFAGDGSPPEVSRGSETRLRPKNARIRLEKMFDSLRDGVKT